MEEPGEEERERRQVRREGKGEKEVEDSLMRWEGSRKKWKKSEK